MDKTILVTGATSGFGEAIARQFAKANWRVVAAGRRGERLQRLVDEFGAEKIAAAAFDLRDAAALQVAMQEIPDAFQQIDVLVNNAGLALGTEKVPEARLENWIRMIETNVTGLVTLTHLLIPRLIERKGMIVNISSAAASYPYPGGNVYGATKAFVTQFSLNLRSDLHGTGVRVTSIEPGFAETEFLMVRLGGDKKASDAFYSGFKPLSAADIANAVFWVVNQPAHFNINRIELMPVSQSSAGFQIFKE